MTGASIYDRRLYLPRDWAEDAARRAEDAARRAEDAAGRAEAEVPAAGRLATKPQVAKDLVLVRRALARGLPVAWVSGDEVYGNDDHRRGAGEGRAAGRPAPPYARTLSAKPAIAVGGPPRPARTLGVAPPASACAWERLSGGEGRKGPRLRASMTGCVSRPINHPSEGPWPRWLVARRGLTNPDDPRSIAYCGVCAPAETRRATLAAVIGERGGLACACAESKGAKGRWAWISMSPRSTTTNAMESCSLLNYSCRTNEAAPQTDETCLGCIENASGCRHKRSAVHRLHKDRRAVK